MPTSKKITRSEKKRNRARGYKDGVSERVHQYLETAYKGNDPEKELAMARRIGEFKGAEARLKSASALVDVAVRHSVSFNGNTALIFSEAIGCTEQVETTDQIGVYTLMASRLKRQASMNMSIAEGEIPSTEKLRKSHDLGVSTIGAIFSVWDKIKSTDLEAAKTAKGFISEEATILLLERYALEQIGEGWVPMHARLSEDNGRINNGWNRSGWDISIYTDCTTDKTIPAHKLQVKTRPTKDDLTYPDSYGIDIVHVSGLHTLSDDKGVQVMPQFILSEFAQAAEGGVHQQRRLDQRTDVLLEIFS